MSFTVEGFIGGVYYTAVVGAEHPEMGVVSGSANVLAYLRGRQGDQYMVTPTGPAGTLDIGSPVSVLGALIGWTKQARVSGDAPDILNGQRRQPGVVY